MKIVHLFGLLIPPITVLLPLARVYSFVSGTGIILIPLCIIAYLIGGWWLIAGLLGGRIAASMIGGILDMLHMKLELKRTGSAYTASERSFSMPTGCWRISMASLQL